MVCVGNVTLASLRMWILGSYNTVQETYGTST